MPSEQCHKYYLWTIFMNSNMNSAHEQYVNNVYNSSNIVEKQYWLIIPTILRLVYEVWLLVQIRYAKSITYDITYKNTFKIWDLLKYIWYQILNLDSISLSEFNTLQEKWDLTMCNLRCWRHSTTLVRMLLMLMLS